MRYIVIVIIFFSSLTMNAQYQLSDNYKQPKYVRKKDYSKQVIYLEEVISVNISNSNSNYKASNPSKSKIKTFKCRTTLTQSPIPQIPANYKMPYNSKKTQK